MRTSVAALVTAAALTSLVVVAGQAQRAVPTAEPRAPIGRELSVPIHLQDGDEYTLPLRDLLAHGKRLFDANWTDQEGVGRPRTKGTGRPLSDMTSPLVGDRAFNRVSAPDANSCAGCHNAPYRISGGGGDIVAERGDRAHPRDHDPPCHRTSRPVRTVAAR